jgi:hypothetical protein
MSSRRHRNEGGEDEGSHDFGSLRFTWMLPIKSLIELVGKGLVGVFSFLTLIAIPARLCSAAEGGSCVLHLSGACANGGSC